MRQEEIKEELELAIRGFIEAKERSLQNSLDDFDELRILEASFNRLFISVEHLCNAIILLEYGNFSKKHFGDINKLNLLKEKYANDLALLYQTTYSFRAYADYRKFPDFKEKFNRKELKKQIIIMDKAISSCLEVISKQLDIKEIKQRLIDSK